MTYAKQVENGTVTMLLTYDYTPEFGEDSDTIIITEEEYNALMEEMIAALPKPDPDRISDSEALAIITGEVDADETK
jgi:hypothetical protein